MVGRTKPILKDDRTRFDRLKQMPCIACHLEGMELIPCGPTEIHHLLSGNKRRGHAYTLPLGAWHHRAKHHQWLDKAGARFLYGPSLADGSKPFRERYGSDDELLAMTNEQLERVA